MTLPAPHKRTTAAERRAQREAFRQANEARKARARPEHRWSNDRWRMRQRLKNLLAGGPTTRPFTAREIATMKPKEREQLNALVKARLDRLTQEQRAALRANLYLALAPITGLDWKALLIARKEPTDDRTEK